MKSQQDFHSILYLYKKLNRLKKVSAIFILLVVAYNIMGIFIFFQSLDYRAKIEAHQMISTGAMDSNYSVIRLPAVSLQSQKHLFSFVGEDEIFWQGTMYDVITKTESADTITYYCFRDDDESMLVSTYLRYLDQKNTANDQQPVSNVLKNLGQLFHLPPGESNIVLTADFIHPGYSFSFSFPVYVECLSPPPDAA